MDKDTIIERLKANRPNLTVSSLYTYSSTLSALYKKVFGNNDIDLDKFNDTSKILEALKDKEYNARKSVLAALFVLTNNSAYRDPMLDDIKQYEDNVSKQEMNDKEKAKFRSQDEIKEILEQLRSEAEHLYKLKTKTSKVFQQIQNYIILCLTSGQYIVPRRLLDWAKMKVTNYDKEKDNYYDGKQFVFNVYKNSNTKPQDKLAVPLELKKILKKWMTINSSDNLLVDSNGNSLNSVKLNQRLTKILNGASVNILRHSYLSTKFQDTLEQNQKIAQTMKDMGSSSLQQQVYIQKLDK
jgi:hypothetical protein